MNTLSEKFELIKRYCDEIEEAGYACYKLFAPVPEEAVVRWETENGAKLPEGHKEFLRLSNGFEMGSSADLLPIERICEQPFREYEGMYIIGHYIGDGSELVCDKTGRFCKLDHAYGLEESTFEDFLDDWIINILEDDLSEIKKTNKDE